MGKHEGGTSFNISNSYYKLREGICLIFIAHLYTKYFASFCSVYWLFYLLFVVNIESNMSEVVAIYANLCMNNKGLILHLKYTHTREITFY